MKKIILAIFVYSSLTLSAYADAFSLGYTAMGLLYNADKLERLFRYGVDREDFQMFTDPKPEVPRTPTFTEKNDSTFINVNLYNKKVIVVHVPIAGGGTVPKYFFLDENGNIKK